MIKVNLHFITLSILAILFCAVGNPLIADSKAEPTVYVSFWFDTEDYIMPEADDAAKRLAEMFTQRKAQATFKIVGEKARMLEKRGRTDVISAISKNDIAFHSNFHSVHPTPAEYTRDLSWHEGVEEFIRREGPGLDSVRKIFGVNASCYGQPGCSWTPQSYAALRQWNIPLYLDATNQVNLNNRPFWYGGLLNILELGDCILRTGWSDGSVKESCETFDKIRAKLLGEGGGIISIYYHPCEFIHKEFWDGVNFAKGANPPRSEWKQPPKKSPAEIEQAFHAFEKYLDYIIQQPQVRLVTAREIPSLYPDRAYSWPLMKEDVLTISQKFQEAVTYVELNSKIPDSSRTLKRIVTAAEGLYALAKYVTEFQNPSTYFPIQLKFIYGPASKAEAFISSGNFTLMRVLDAAQDYLDFVQRNEQMPSVIYIDGKPVRPEDFAATLAAMVAGHFKNEISPAAIPLMVGNFTVQKFTAEDKPALWDWVIFPPGFHAPILMENARLQTWTLKPANLSNE